MNQKKKGIFTAAWSAFSIGFVVLNTFGLSTVIQEKVNTLLNGPSTAVLAAGTAVVYGLLFLLVFCVVSIVNCCIDHRAVGRMTGHTVWLEFGDILDVLKSLDEASSGQRTVAIAVNRCFDTGVGDRLVSQT